MARGYFSFFRESDYVFSDSVVRRVRNLSQYTAIFFQIADDNSFYGYLTLQGNERLDGISQRLYNTPEFYWTIPLLNPEIINVWKDLPIEQNTLNKRLDLKYPGRAFYVDSNDTIVGKFNIGETIRIDSETSGVFQESFPSLGYIRLIDIIGDFPTNTNLTLIGDDSGDTLNVTNNTKFYKAPFRFSDSDSNTVLYDNTNSSVRTIQDDEIDKNTKRSQIRVIRSDKIVSVVNEFTRQMRR